MSSATPHYHLCPHCSQFFIYENTLRPHISTLHTSFSPQPASRSLVLTDPDMPVTQVDTANKSSDTDAKSTGKAVPCPNCSDVFRDEQKMLWHICAVHGAEAAVGRGRGMRKVVFHIADSATVAEDTAADATAADVVHDGDEAVDEDPAGLGREGPTRS